MKPWNNHNHYHGEELHDDGYFGPEATPDDCWEEVQCVDCKRKGDPIFTNKCEQCGDILCETCDSPVEVYRMLMCSLCASDYLEDHPQMNNE